MNRAFYGVRLLQTKSGIFTNAVFGTANIIKRNLDFVNPDYFAVAFDVHAPTFRHNSYDKYKSNRHGMPEELRLQVPYIKRLLEAIGAKCIELAGYEADDILGTLSLEAEKNGDKAYVLTGDRDSLQLISDNTTVLLATNNDYIEYTPNVFFEKYGVMPDQFVDVKALMGDSSDCIPGVAGIGEKTAFKLIAENKSLDGIYNTLDSIKLTPSVKEKLSNGKDSAYMSQYLATIIRNVPLDIKLDDLQFNGYNKKALLELFTELESTSLIKKFELDVEDSAENVDIVTDSNVCEISDLKLDNIALMYDYENSQYILGDGNNISITDNYDEVYEVLKKASHVITYDKKSILHIVNDNDLFWNFDDVMLMGYVISASENDYSIKKLISREFVTEIDELEKCVNYLPKLYDAYLSRMNDAEKKLYYVVELPLCGVLYDMEEYGFKIDVDKLKEFSNTLNIMKNEYEQRIFMQTGEEFNINSPKQLGIVLFEKMKLPFGKKTKTGYSTNAEILNMLKPYSAVVSDILDYRQVGKFKSTYADGLTEVADKNGRVHTCFKQALTATGRLSSTEPNLQNIPIRTELGREFRKYFVPENEDYVLIDADYSQIELRLLAAISNDESLIDAFKSGFDVHTATAMKVFHVSADEVTIPLRKRAKAINFGIVYGIGDYTLANDLEVTMKEASAYIKSYFETYPMVKSYLDGIVNKAHEDKYVETLFGRKRYIPQLMSTKKMEIAFGERVAMNSPIQGTAADIIKIAMVNTYKKLKEKGYDAKLVLQVHDELIIEANKNCADDVKNLLIGEMENAVSLSVPLTVGIGVGKTWYDAKD